MGGVSILDLSQRLGLQLRFKLFDVNDWGRWLNSIGITRIRRVFDRNYQGNFELAAQVSRLAYVGLQKLSVLSNFGMVDAVSREARKV